MATAVNSTVKCYSGVPLMRGGTEVLYLAQGEAEGALSGFLRKAFSHYYYVRETENYIQVDSTIGELEGCNYVSFANYSHGGKLFFGFIRALEYVNDNCTGIYFDIDPFPTYLGDCTEDPLPFVVRNTPVVDSPAFIADDFDFQGEPYRYNLIGSITLPIGKSMTIFTGGKLVNEEGVVLVDTDTLHAPELVLYGHRTGLHYTYNMEASDVKLVTQAGGSILGVYAVDWEFDGANPSHRDITAPLDYFGARHEKLKTGQYNKISVIVCGKSKSYDLNKFQQRDVLYFRLKRLVSPTPTLAVYPLYYEGVLEATHEALIIEYPMLATSVSNYVNPSASLDRTVSTINTLFTGALSGKFSNDTSNYYVNRKNLPNFAKVFFGGLGGAAAATTEVMSNAAGLFKSTIGSLMNGEINTDSGGLVLTADNAIKVDIIQTCHSADDISCIDKYFDYFGYAFNEFRRPNTLHDNYLQTGSPFLRGSEADVILNQMLERGIKIKKHF